MWGMGQKYCAEGLVVARVGVGRGESNGKGCKKCSFILMIVFCSAVYELVCLINSIIKVLCDSSIPLRRTSQASNLKEKRNAESSVPSHSLRHPFLSYTSSINQTLTLHPHILESVSVFDSGQDK